MKEPQLSTTVGQELTGQRASEKRAEYQEPCDQLCSHQSPHDPAIRVRDLRRTYRSQKRSPVEAVKGISFELARGQVLGLLGTNGAGKTSTLEMLEGLASPSSGEITVFGMDPVKDKKRLRPHQGVVLQSGSFSEELTPKETLRMWAGTLSRARNVDSVLERVGLKNKANVKVQSLSGGEKRRLDIACGIVNEPSILFLDEPTTGLDVGSRRECWEIVRELNERGTTIVLSTHYLEEAEALCHQFVIMHDGGIVKQGSYADIIAGYPSVVTVQRPWAELLAAGIHEHVGMARRAYEKEMAAPASGPISTTWHTTTPQEDVRELLDWAARAGVDLPGLKVNTADLNQVFLDVAASDERTGDAHDPAVNPAEK